MCKISTQILKKNDELVIRVVKDKKIFTFFVAETNLTEEEVYEMSDNERNKYMQSYLESKGL